MAYKSNMGTRLAAFSAALGIAIITIPSQSNFANTASAAPAKVKVVSNNKLKVGKYKLLKACGRSGGTWHNYSGKGQGTGYGCDVVRKDGSSSHITCENSGKCIGTNRTPQ